MLVGNKADLADQREVQEKQAKELADKYGWVFVFPFFCVWCVCLNWNNDHLDIKNNTVYFSFAYSVICSQEDVTGLSESSLRDVIFSFSLTTLCYPSVGL